jgi:outer membrane protein OmpA-like peptidoglycan-associated protein
VIHDSIRIQGQVTNNITFSNLINNSVAIMGDEAFKSAYYSPDGKQILTISEKGTVINWNAESGSKNFQFENKHLGTVVFFPNYNRLVSITDCCFDIYTNRNGLLMLELGAQNDRVLTSFTYINGQELYASIYNYNSLRGFDQGRLLKKYNEVSISPKSKFGIAFKDNSLRVFKANEPKRGFTLKLNDDFEKAILHKSENVLVVSNRSSTILYNLELEKEVKNYPNETFIQYTSTGEFFITEDSENRYLYSISMGNKVFSLPAKCEYTLSENNKFAAYYYQNTLIVYDVASSSQKWSSPYNKVSHMQFFPESEKLLFLSNDSLYIVNYSTKEVEFTGFAETGFIKTMQIAQNEKSILIAASDIVSVWDIETHFDADTTSYFKIEVPQPKVSENIHFGKQFIGKTTEEVFTNLIQNKTQNIVVIDSVYFQNTSDVFTLVSPQNSIKVNKGEGIPIEIRFTPQKAEIFKESLIIISGKHKFECVVSGQGISRNFNLLNPDIQFSAINVKTSSDTIIPILRNSGTELINIKDFKLLNASDDNFSVNRIGKNLILKGDTVWARINFNPKARGRQNAQLQLNVDEFGWQNATQISGEGIAKRTLVLAGKTLLANTNKPVAAQVLVTELNSGNVVTNTDSHPFGFYSAPLKTDLNYSVSAHLKGYFSSSENIDLRPLQNSDTIWVDITLTPLLDSLTVKLNNIFFDFGESMLLDISKPEVNRVVNLMKRESNLKIVIHGHTDNVGDAGKNIELSKRRAIAVKEFLVNHNINKNRVIIKYHGENQPIANNTDELGRKANRRVEIRFVK